MRRWLTLAAAAVMTMLPALAQDTATVVLDTDVKSEGLICPTLSMFTLDVGYASLHDSYLTPITYDGVNIAPRYEIMRAARFRPHSWIKQLQAGVDYCYTENPAGNNEMHRLLADVSYSLQHRWRKALLGRVDLSAGPMVSLRAGVTYDPANSNNTVSARVHTALGVTGMATWNTHMWRLPVTLRYQAQLPVIGVFFAPEYNESYYEVYLGNERDLAHASWWGSRFDMTHFVGADLHLGRTILRVGYRSNFECWTVNDLHVHDVTHSLVIGIGGEFLRLSPRARAASPAIVSPLY